MNDRTRVARTLRGMMELLLLIVGAVIWVLLRLRTRHQRTARARKHKPIHYVSILP